MSFQKIATLTMALAMLVLSQHSLPSQGRSVCEYSLEVERINEENASPDDIRNLVSLFDGQTIMNNLAVSDIIYCTNYSYIASVRCSLVDEECSMCHMKINSQEDPKKTNFLSETFHSKSQTSSGILRQ